MLVAETQLEFQMPTVVPRKGSPVRKGTLLTREPHHWDFTHEAMPQYCTGESGQYNYFFLLFPASPILAHYWILLSLFLDQDPEAIARALGQVH